MKKWNDAQLVLTVKESFSFQEVFQKLGFSGSNTRVRRRVDELQLDTSHWFRKSCKPRAHKLPLDQVLIQNSTYTCTSALKAKLLKAGVLYNKCYECGLTSWRNKPLSLQLDHINGDRRDNRIENLRILCPNCHAQTDTYSGKNNKKERRKCREKVRYSCPYCGRKTHNSKIGACQKCMIKNQLGIYRRKLSAKQEQEVIRKNSKGMSITKLAKQYSVSKDTITKIVKKLYSLPM